MVGIGADVEPSAIASALNTSDVTIKIGNTVQCSGASCGPGANGAGDIIVADGTVINYSQMSAQFLDKNVGNNKPVEIQGIRLTGDNAHLYPLNSLEHLHASISKADLNLLGVTASNKTYNGNTTARLSAVF